MFSQVSLAGLRVTFQICQMQRSYSTLAIVGAAVFFVIAERIWPYTKGQKVLREGFFDDLALYTIAQSYILGILIFHLRN